MVLNMFADRLLDENLATGIKLFSCGQNHLSLGYQILIDRTKLLAEQDESLKIEKSSPLFLFIVASSMTSLIGAAFIMPVVQYASLYRIAVEGKKNLMT